MLFMWKHTTTKKTMSVTRKASTHPSKDTSAISLSNVTLHFSDPSGWVCRGDTDSEGRFILRIVSKTSALEARTCKVWVSLPPPVKEDKGERAASKAKRSPEVQYLLKKYVSADVTQKTVELNENGLKVNLD